MHSCDLRPARAATWTGLLALNQREGAEQVAVVLRPIAEGGCMCVLVRGAPLRSTSGSLTVLRDTRAATALLGYLGVRRFSLSPDGEDADGLDGLTRECCRMRAGRLSTCRECAGH